MRIRILLELAIGLALCTGCGRGQTVGGLDENEPVDWRIRRVLVGEGQSRSRICMDFRGLSQQSDVGDDEGTDK